MLRILNKRTVFAVVILAWLTLPGLLPPLGERGGTVAASDILGCITVMYCLFLSTHVPMRFAVADIALFVYMIVIIFSCLFYFGEENSTLLYARAVRFVLISSPAFLFIFSRIDSTAIRLMLRIYIASATIGIFISLAAYSMGVQSAMANQTAESDMGGVINRAGGWVGDSSAFGHQISSLALVLLIGLLSGALRFRIYHLVSFAVILYGLYASSSRSALVTIIGVAGLFLFFGPGNTVSKFRSVFVLTLIAVVGFAVVYFAYSLGYFKELGNVVDRLLMPFKLIFDSRNASAVSSGRLQNWGALFDRVGWKVLYGTGFGTLPLLYGIEDNVVIKTLGETGITGLLAITTVILSAMIRFWKRRRIDIFSLFLFFTIGQCINAMFVDTTSFFSSMPQVILMGFACYKSYPDFQSLAFYEETTVSSGSF